MNSIMPLCRSMLFVPGGHQRRIEKSSVIPADVLVFDLEDAVPPSEKISARKMVVDALKSTDFSARYCVVRVNGVSTSWFLDDVAALSEINSCAIMLPKYERADDLVKLNAAQCGQKKSIFGIIETAAGVISAAELAKNMSVGDALCFGHVDFAADMGLSENDANKGVICHARCQVVLAAHAFGVLAIDNISLEVSDEVIMRNEAVEGLDLGYQGKMCIHPRQVDIVNDVYTPTEQQVEKAKNILVEWDALKEQGQGVFTFENKMVDLPVIRAQQSILARYNAIMDTES